MTKPLSMPDSHLLDLMAYIQQRGSKEAVATLAILTHIRMKSDI